MKLRNIFISIHIIGLIVVTNESSALAFKKVATQSAKLKTLASLLKRADLFKSAIKTSQATNLFARFGTPYYPVAPLHAFIGLKILAGGAATTITSLTLWEVLQKSTTETDRHSAQQMLNSAIMRLDAPAVDMLLRQLPELVLNKNSYWDALNHHTKGVLTNNLTEAQEAKLQAILDRMLTALGKIHKDAKNDQESNHIDTMKDKTYNLGLQIQKHQAEREYQERKLSKAQGKTVKLTPTNGLD